MDNKIKKSCPNCSQLYYIKSISPGLKGNLPLFLICGHSMCENCVRNLVKFMEPIECKVCHQDMEVKANDIALLVSNRVLLHNFFPVNMYMVGELTMQAIEGQESSTKKPDGEHFINLQALLKSVDDTQGKCVECNNPTSKMCIQCAMILCDMCFTKSHKNFIIFKNHVLRSIETLTELNTCKIHSDKLLDYYCKDCTKTICMDCMMVGGEKSCKNHNVVSMAEVNETFVEKLQQISPKVDEMFRMFTKTAVDIGHLLHNIENETGSSTESTHLIADMEQHFSKLFRALQEHKKSVMNVISNYKNSEKDSLIQAKNNLKDAIKKARQVMKSINLITDPKKSKQVNLALLLEDAKNVIETPWYLCRDKEKKDPLKLVVKEDLCNLVSDFMLLEGSANGAYRLQPTAELDGVKIPPPPPAPVYPPELPKDVRQVDKSKPKDSFQFCKNAPKYRSKSGSVSSLNSVGSDHSNRTYATHGDMYQRPVDQQGQAFEEGVHPTQLYEGSKELIYISHIVDPHNFFVQRASHQSLVKDMLKEFRNAISLPKPSIKHVAEGKVYLAFHKADNMWQRCRVISIDRRIPTNPVFHVFCLDFGSTEAVTIDKLRLLSPAKLQSPYPLAINCSLANCVPKNGAWTNDDSFLIQNIIDNKQAVIHVRKIHTTNNVLMKFECDVITFEGGINIVHALVFHERAKMVNPKIQYPTSIGIKEIPKIFMNNKDFKVKTPEEVFISHIVSPDKFFVRKRHFQNIYTKLCEDLEQEYSLGSNTGTVYLPEIGAVYAVNVEKCSPEVPWGAHGSRGRRLGAAWARGVALELPGRARVRLLLPDCGATVLPHCSMLRRIHSKFTTLQALAVECHLAGVTPLNKMWSTGSVVLLQKFEDRLLELQVEDMSSRGSMGVTLYDKQNEDNIICINNEMIKHKFAVTFGLFKFNMGEDIKNQSFTENNLPLEEPTRPKQQSKKIQILTKNTPLIEEKDLEAKDKGPLRLEAKLLQYQSPSLLYVSLVHQQKAFNELYENMQKYYSTSRKIQEKMDWNVGDKCCTLCTQSETWRRAVIVEKEKDVAKVFYSDFACIETVPLANLKELTTEFAAIGNAAIKCHLSGVIPAVGEEWPSLTKEFLKELLDAYNRVFITKSGNFKNKSMPVEVWVYHTIQGGALDPNVSEWRCLNKKIIDQGLGIPDKQEAIGQESGVEGDGDMLSFLNVTGSVHEWLQLEHNPMKPLPNKSNSGSNTNSSTPIECDEENNSDREPDTSTVFISDWLPPEPLPCKEFTAMPTYIDNDGLIYLHDITQRDTLDLIRKALDLRFKLPDPKAKYAKWAVGEPCIAMFFLDNRFYRGKVLDVNKETSMCLIHYIDYGNEEQCSFANLRKCIALYQIPTQAHRCVLDRIRPKEKRWDREALDYMHKSIVEKHCYVKITGEKINGVIPIELKYNKLWFNEHLVDFDIAEYIDGSKAVVRKFAPVRPEKKAEEILLVESDSGPDYIVEDQDSTELLSSSQESSDFKSLAGKDWNKVIDEEEQHSLDGDFIEFPNNNAFEFLCNITVINDIETLQLDIIHNDETNIIYEEMFEKLQNMGDNMKPLNGIYEHKACIALFPDDGKWYRATVLQYSEANNKIKVRYADYGNIEIIPMSDVREISLEFTKLTPASMTVKLHGILLNPDVDVNFVIQEYTKTFLDKGPFYAKVINNIDPIPYVELRNDNGNLVYETLIESEIFKKTVE